MPKKFKGENTKAAAARQRKADARHEKEERLAKEKEDEFWKDDDKHAMRKQQRKEDKEKKRQEQIDRKLENQKALEDEMNSMPSRKLTKPVKVTRAEIQQKIETESEDGAKSNKTVAEEPIHENLNHMTLDGEEARTVEEALSILGRQDSADKHPERRLKAAYAAFEAANLPRLKEENPNLRLSQLKQMLKKDWMKSPDNPMNQRSAAYNSKP